MTKRLYQDDPYRTTFESRVMRRFPEGDRSCVVLEETCFYPTSGGQYCDLGELGRARVEDVREENGEVVHILSSDPGDDRLTGRVDWNRRYDHMQQHTGQHILSQAFFRVLDLETVSAHLGTDVSSIELPAERVVREAMDRVESEANGIVFECRPTRAVWMDREEAVRRGIRKVPEREGRLRIVEVEGYDLSACGGTHCRLTGEVGLIKIGRTERIRRQTRVEFLCGWRALEDYQRRWTWAEEAALRLGRRPRDLPEEVSRLIDETVRRDKEVARLQDEVLGYRAREILAETELAHGVRIVRTLVRDLSRQQLAALGGYLVSKPGVVALLGLEGETGHVVAARSEGLGLDMAALVRRALGKWGGRGGGKPAFAQGGLEGGHLEAALEELGRAVEGEIVSGS